MDEILLSIKRNKWKIAKYVLAISFAAIWILPILNLVMISIRPFEQIVHGWWNFGEFTLKLANYVEAWTNPAAPLGRALLNSAKYAIPPTVMNVILAAMVAYPIARFKFPLRKILFFIIIFIMVIPPETIIMTNYETLTSIGLLDSFPGAWLVSMGWGIAWMIIFLRNFILSVPDQIEEAARVDGASDFEIFYKIVLPMIAPALASVGIIQFVWSWNAIMFPLVILRSPENWVATQSIVRLKSRYFGNWGPIAAGSIIAMIVPVVVFLLTQRYFKRGIAGRVPKG